jgi:hypothetical protein
LLAVGLLLTGCSISADPPGTGTQTSTPGSFSTLDTAGVEQVPASKTARLDMSSGTLQKAAVNVTEDSYGPEISIKGSGKINLTIVGPAGEVSGETDRIRFCTRDAKPDFGEITYFLTTDSADEYFNLIRGGAERYGIDRAAAVRWISTVLGKTRLQERPLPPFRDLHWAGCEL